VSSLRRHLAMFLHRSVSILTKQCLHGNYFAERARALRCCAWRVWHKSCFDMEALLREGRKGKFSICLPCEKPEESYAKKTRGSMCR
jgi:hypothetical protein